LLLVRRWGSFLEVRTNAAESYRDNYPRESNWARRNRDGFAIFLSSATEPFLPQEFRFGITRSVLAAMLELPPDRLILQTHSHRVTRYLDLLLELSRECELRVHVSVETDRDQIPGLPAHASPVEKRLAACRILKEAGLTTVVTVSPLLPIAQPAEFFGRIAAVADAVVIDHFIEGDGSPDGSRTWRTPLPKAMEAIDPRSITLEYRDEIVTIARRHLPGRVGVSIGGFAGEYA
jgi:DNA repair photolyase